MRGVVLAGGLGTRLAPLTNVVNKHLLPVYDKPMIFYPLEILRQAGIKEVALVVSGKNPGQFIEILKNGQDFGFDNIVYLFQEKPDGGIADGLRLAENFAQQEPICVILGDNCMDISIQTEVQNFSPNSVPTCHLFLKPSEHPERYGVATITQGQIQTIVEKPINPSSNLAVIGVYLYDTRVFDFIKRIQPSARGQLEITDINQLYLTEGRVTFTQVEGFWQDCGNFDSLCEAQIYWYQHKKKTTPQPQPQPQPQVDAEGTKRWTLNGQLHRADGPAVEHADGYKAWWIKGQRHRTDGPAVELTNGSKEWWVNGQLHRTDGPAVEYANEHKEWHVNGQRHRTDGPAVERSDGAKEWYLKGQRHRTDGPAVEHANGDKWWYLNGQPHRTDGPAVEWADGTKYWYFQGRYIKASSLEEFQQQIK